MISLITYFIDVIDDDIDFGVDIKYINNIKIYIYIIRLDATITHLLAAPVTGSWGWHRLLEIYRQSEAKGLKMESTGV